MSIFITQDTESSLYNGHHGFVRKCSLSCRKCHGTPYFKSWEGPFV